VATTIDYLDRFLEPISDALTPAVARKIADLRAESDLQARMDELAAKANEGKLTPDEDTEYKSYIEAADIVGVIRAKARRFLAENPA